MTELEILTQTIKKHTNKDLGDSYNMLGGTTLTQLIVKAMQAYHTAKLEEVKGLPSEKEWMEWATLFKRNNGEIPNSLETHTWLRSIAQSVIVKEREGMQKIHQEALDSISHLREEIRKRDMDFLKCQNEITALKSEIARLSTGGIYGT